MNKKKRELETNELASALGQKLEVLRPHAFLITAITVAIILAIILVAWMIDNSRRMAAAQWDQLFLASLTQDSRNLEDVAVDHPDSLVGYLGLLKAADMEMANGLVQTNEDLDVLRRHVQSAKENYRRVAETTANIDPVFKRRAVFGWAYASEALGEFEEAERLYRQLVEQAAGTPIHAQARHGLNRVQDQTIGELLTAYASWKPSTVAPQAPEPQLPLRPDIRFPHDSNQTGQSSERTFDPSDFELPVTTDDPPPPPTQDDSSSAPGGG